MLTIPQKDYVSPLPKERNNEIIVEQRVKKKMSNVRNRCGQWEREVRW